MLKKLLVLLVFTISICAYLFSNGLFLFESVKIVKGYKSLGEFSNQVNLPFIEKVGVYKSFNSDYNYALLVDKYDAKLAFIESVSGVTSYYFYSKKLPFKEVIKNKKVNLQIAVSSDKVTIGSPIIYGGY
jgi:hypothetical protein